MKHWKSGLLSLALGLVVTAGATAQDQPAQPAQPAQPGQPGQGGRGQRGNLDPAAMRQRYYDRIKQDLGASDDEWKALQPKVEVVLNAQRDSRGNRGGGGPGGGRTRGGNNGADAQPAAATQDQSEVAKAAAELQAAVKDASTPPAILAQKLGALREAKEKAKAKTAAAQKDLKDLLTQRQEAILVNTGVLD